MEFEDTFSIYQGRIKGKELRLTVRDQGDRDTCWHAACVGCIELRLQRKHAMAGTEYEGDLAPQELVDFKLLKHPKTIYEWIRCHGIQYQADYADFTGQEPKEKKEYVDENARRLFINGHVSMKAGGEDEDIANVDAELMAFGAVVAVLKIHTDWDRNSSFYTGVGAPLIVGEGEESDQALHAVVVIGWGECEEGDYWIFVNSYGEGWGDLGIGRVLMHLVDCFYFPLV